MNIQQIINEKKEEFNQRKEFFTNPIYNEERRRVLLEEELKAQDKEQNVSVLDEQPQQVIIQQLIPVQASSISQNVTNLDEARARVMNGVKEHFSKAKNEGHVFGPSPKRLNPIFHGKKAQGGGFITIIFFTIVFIVVWVLFFAEQLAFWGHQAVLINGLTGVEALFYNNVNMIVLFVLIIFILAIGYMGFGGGR